MRVGDAVCVDIVLVVCLNTLNNDVCSLCGHGIFPLFKYVERNKCFFCGHCLALCSTEQKIATGPNKGTNEDHSTKHVKIL